MTSKTAVILGGGIGGIVAANKLREQLATDHRVILVERNEIHAFAPSFLWLVTGDRKPSQIQRPLASLLRRGVELVHAAVTGIDLGSRTVRTGEGEIRYDYLIVALGAELAWDAVPGLDETVHTFYSFDGSEKLGKALRSFSGGTIAIVVAAVPYKCPGAPPEAAMLIADYFRKRGLSSTIKIQWFTPEPQPMPVAGPQLGEAVRSMLASKGVSFHPLHKLAQIEPRTREVVFENQGAAPYDLLIVIPPHRAPAVVVEAGLTGPTGWIPVDAQTLATDHGGVYAIGDVTSIPIPGRWKPDVPLSLPKAGVFAHTQAEVVARRISSEINGRSSEVSFCGDGYCMLEAGEDLAGFAFGNFFADPAPEVHLRQIGRAWHLGKVLFEKWWLSPAGVRHTLAEWALRAGARMYGIPISL
jgi:sulfide:quinone oxidoreductase